MKYISLFLLFVCVFTMKTGFAQDDLSRWESYWSFNVHLHKDYFGSDYEKPDSTNPEYPSEYYYYTQSQFHFDLSYNVFYNLNEHWAIGSSIYTYNKYSDIILDEDFVCALSGFNIDYHPVSSTGWETNFCLPIILKYKYKKLGFFVSFKNPILSVGFSNSTYKNRPQEKYLSVLFGGTTHGIDYRPEYRVGLSVYDVMKTKHCTIGLSAAYSISRIHQYRKYFSIGLILKAL